MYTGMCVLIKKYVPTVAIPGFIFWVEEDMNLKKMYFRQEFGERLK
jgi:hypothetical protein